MTATTVVRRRRPSCPARSAGFSSSSSTALRQMVIGYWLVMLLGFTAAGVIHATVVNGTINESVWDYACQSPKYFNASVGVMLTPVFLTLLVAHGVTRRTLAIAGGVLLVLNAAVISLLWALIYLLERGLFSWQGWPQQLTNPHLFTDTSQSGLVFTEFFLLVLSHEVAGWLIGTTFFRFRFWGGLALLPLTVLPAVATELLLVSSWVAQAFGDNLDRPPVGVSVPVVLAICAAGLYVNHLVLRGIGLKPPRS